MTSFTVELGNQNYASIDGTLFNKNKTTLIAYPASKIGSSYTIPSTATRIEKYAFYGAKSLTSITIPSSVTSIGDSAFEGASTLISITIPEGVTKIAEATFSDATSLISVTIPDSVTYIDYYAFSGATALTSISIPANIKTIEEGAFYGATSLKEIYFRGNAPEYVGDGAFYEIANGAKAIVSATATGFGTGQTWNGLVVEIAVKPSYVSGVKLTGTAKVGKAVAVSKGTWKGTGAIAYTYQWYVCKSASTKVLTTGKVAPKCTLIKNAKATSFKPTAKEKAGYLAVLITGTNKTGKSAIFTSTSGKVS
jgi:hypothetical protein